MATNGAHKRGARDSDGIERRVLGDRLRMLRVRRQLSGASVALGTGMSRSFIAMLEAGQTDISVSRLLRLAEFYGVWLSDLVGTVAPAVEVIRRDDARLVPGADKAAVRLLASEGVRTILPFRVDLPVGARLDGGMSHSGEEFVHCVEGVIDLEVVDAVHRLTTGDTASFPGRLPHSYTNAGDVPAVIVGAAARHG